VSDQPKSKNQYEDEMNAKGSRDFRFYMPIDMDSFEKSLKTDKDSDPKSWRVGGIASTSQEDLENETILPEGIQTDYYLRFGLITWDHQKGPENKIGIPTDAKVTPEGFWTEGYLLKDVPAAQHVHNLMKTLATGKHDRKMQWSVEGKTLMQEGGRILKCWLKDCTLTMNGVNNNTYANLLKSLKTCVEDESLESMPEVKSVDKSVESISSIESVDKGLEAGYQVEGQTGGDALRTQDLDQYLKVLTYKSLTPADAVHYVMLKSHVSSEVAKKILRYVDMYAKLKGKK
jgi:hypothetical protein